MRQMVQPAKGQEPSMEEILASIRRIIADDEGAKTQPPKSAETVAPQPAPPSSPESPLRTMMPVPPSSVEPAMPPLATPATAREREDFPMPASFAPEPEPEPDAEDFQDVPARTERMTAEPLVDAGFRTVDTDLDVIFGETSPPPMPAPVAVMPQAPIEPPTAEPAAWGAPRAEHSLISASTSAAVDSAFNTLAQTVLVQNGRTLEDLVREMLRPMLKSWLDDNLPGLVERLVRAEIERVSRGRT
jgi:cell pole-organizing protein PopZ